jgi:methyl-accepting chemotaxis protein
VVSGIGLLNPKSQVEQDRMAKTRHLTDVAYGVAA